MKMRTTGLAILLCLSADVGSAQTDCNSMRGAGDLISCYEGAAPPPAAGRAKRSKPVTSEPSEARVAGTRSKSSTGQDPQIDVLEIENSKLDAKMKTICRG